MESVIFLLLFMTGASVGSFLNVMIGRSIQGDQWQTGRSHCDHCQKTLAWYDMIPLLSYLFYRGKSRCCHKTLSIQHPIVELLMGSLFVWWFFVGSWFFRLVTHPLTTVQPLFWLLTGVLLLTIAITDLFYGLIPTLFVGIGVILTLLYRLVLAVQGTYQWIDLGNAIWSAMGAWLFFWLLRKITHEKGMGDGDVILAYFLGLLLGWPKTLVGILAGFVLGATGSLILVMLRRKKLQSTVPFGPFMIAGALLTLVWGEYLLKLFWI